MNAPSKTFVSSDSDGMPALMFFWAPLPRLIVAPVAGSQP